MTPIQESEIAINNMFQDTLSILKRPDTLQKQLLKESWIGFGIELDEINLETKKVLADKSWRNKK